MDQAELLGWWAHFKDRIVEIVACHRLLTLAVLLPRLLELLPPLLALGIPAADQPLEEHRQAANVPCPTRDRTRALAGRTARESACPRMSAGWRTALPQARAPLGIVDAVAAQRRLPPREHDTEHGGPVRTRFEGVTVSKPS